MKKNKIIGISVALLGTAISVGTAVALYKKQANPSSFSFGAFTYEALSGDIDYLVGSHITTYSADSLENDTTNGLNPDNTAVWVKVPISASYPSTQGVVGQSTIGGKLTATVTLSDALATAGVTMETAVYVNGYANDTYYKDHSKAIDNTVLSSSSKTVTGSVEIGVSTVATNQTALSFANNQYAIIWMSFTGINDTNIMTLGGGSAYSIHLNWTKMDAVPHIVGDANNFTEVDEFQMVPVINESIDFVKWTYSGLTGFEKMKVKDGNDWIGAASDGDDMGNVQISSSTSYNVYYGNGKGNLAQSENQGTHYITNC